MFYRAMLRSKFLFESCISMHIAPPPGSSPPGSSPLVALVTFDAFSPFDAFFSAWAGSSCSGWVASGWNGRTLSTKDNVAVALIFECLRILTRLAGFILLTHDGFAGSVVTTAYTAFVLHKFFLRFLAWIVASNRVSGVWASLRLANRGTCLMTFYLLLAIIAFLHAFDDIGRSGFRSSRRLNRAA